MLDFQKFTSSVLLAGDRRTAFRDPAVYYQNGTFYFFFTKVETEADGQIYLYLASTTTTDLQNFTPIKKLSPRDRSLNFSSPGNVICVDGKFYLCCQTYCRENGEKFGNSNSRIWLWESDDLVNWQYPPRLLKVKGRDVPQSEMGRIIDPYLIKDEQSGFWYCFFKQNGVSFSRSKDLENWEFCGSAESGENVCVVKDGDIYRMWHSPVNGIGEMHSRDLLHWQDDGKLLTLGQKQWPWAKGRLTAGFVLDLRKDPEIGKALMFFHGTGPRDEHTVFDQYASIGFAWSDDLENWDFVPGKPEALQEYPEKYWDIKKLAGIPSYVSANFPESESPGLQAILYDGVDDKGAPAQVFAYIGYPEGEAPAGGFPAVVLVHGGGGTAYDWAVKLWNSYGYAVIAIDWYNQRPISPEGGTRADLPGGKRQDHIANISNMFLAHSLLRSLPGVDPDKTAFVGLSWGSWYGGIIAALDDRFKCIINIYCGDRNPDQIPDRALIDGRFLHAAKVPVYYVAGTNDANVTPRTLQDAFDECGNLWNHSMIIGLPHSHIGYRFNLCRFTADHFLRGTIGLPEFEKCILCGRKLSAAVNNAGEAFRFAKLCFTTDREHSGKTDLRKWQSIPADFDGKVIRAELPEDVFQCFFSLWDSEKEDPLTDNCSSSEMLEFP